LDILLPLFLLFWGVRKIEIISRKKKKFHFVLFYNLFFVADASDFIAEIGHILGNPSKQTQLCDAQTFYIWIFYFLCFCYF
jgi:hypothetical protein